MIFTSSRTKSRAWNSYGIWKFMVIQLIFMNMNFDEKFMNFLNMNFTSHELAVNMNNTFMENLKILYLKAMNIPWIWISRLWMSSNMNPILWIFNINTNTNSWNMISIIAGKIRELHELCEPKQCSSSRKEKKELPLREIKSYA